MPREKHGMCAEKIYRKWADMLSRCSNPKSTNYKYYGLRGVRVCEEWKDFIKFKDWAFDNGYEKGLSIDRVDSAGNYEPKNCRWATREEQDNNKRDTIKIDIKGEILSLAEVSRKYNVGYPCLQHRYNVGDRGEKLIEPRHRGVKRNGKQKDKAPIKLSFQEISEIKWLLLNTELFQSEIGEKYNVTQGMVSRIKLEKAFKNVELIEPNWWGAYGKAE